MGGTDGGEVPFVGVVRPFAVLDAADELGDDEVEIGVALTVGVGRHVDRHAVDRGGEVGAVIEVDAAQVVLVRFALAAVLGDDQAGDAFQQLARSQKRPVLELLRRNGAFGRGVGGTDQVVAVGDIDGLQRLNSAGRAVLETPQENPRKTARKNSGSAADPGK